MIYSKDFFALQVTFALKVKEVTENIDIEECLRLYTGFYKYFKIPDWEFRKDNPKWIEYMNLINQSEDITDTSYQFYLNNLNESDETSHHPKFGCFSYEYEEKDNAIQIHFTNKDDPNIGALSKERADLRRQELKEMFTEIKNKFPDLKEIWGFSWLYNIEAYQRLFPQEYLKTKVEVKNWFRSQALWGQFIDNYGKVKNDLAERLLECIKDKTTIEELRMCFPYSIQELIVRPQVFYDFYNIEDTV